LSFGPDTAQTRVIESDKPIILSRCDASSLAGKDDLDHEPAIQRSGDKSLAYISLSSLGTTLGG
jgi:hypothetical protein